jgi:hypothetical protein
MIYPNVFPSLQPNHAERQVFQALEKLGDGFDVFYSKSFARKHPKEALLYEIDFLVFDVREGKLNHIFIIEVKGGSMSYNSKRNKWKSGENYLDTAPEKQAMDYVKNLIARYYYTIKGKVPVTWLLWFPDGLKGKREYLPSHLSFWRILDQYALKDPLSNFDMVIKYLKDDFASFEGVDLEVYEQEIKKELTQTFTVTANLKSLLEEMQLTFDQLEQQQKIFFTGLLGIPRMAVEGGAGSGKTVLARFSAIHIAETGKRVLLLCFNQYLKNQLSEGLPDRIVVNTIHTFMLDHIARFDYDWFGNENKKDGDLFDLRIPQKFREMLQQHPWPDEQLFDAIIVDEAQDMNGEWIQDLLGLLRPNGQMLVFYDNRQNIFEKPFFLPESETWAPIKLPFNHRNAKLINDFINETIGLKIAAGSVPEGLPVKIKAYQEESLLEELERILLQLVRIQKLSLEQITILVDGSTTDWDLGGVQLSSGFTLAWMKPGFDREENRLYMTSANRFKGCESDIIILILKEPLLPITNENIRYTQMSRAKGGLWILEKH